MRARNSKAHIAMLAAVAILLGLIVPIVGVSPAHAVSATFVVTTTSDTGAGSLREAITSAELTTDEDTITFDPTVFTAGTLHTITLATTLPTITKPLIIQGPGRDVLAISGNDSVRIFKVDQRPYVAPGRRLDINDLTLTHGHTSIWPGGGAIVLDGSMATLRRVTVSNCQATVASGGGGGAAYVGSSSLTVIDSTLEDNSTNRYGGALRSDYGSIGDANTFVSIQNSIIRRNAASDGGAIYGARQVLLDGATIVNNTASSSGGALYLGYSYNHSITNSEIKNNAAPSGGAILAGGGYWYKGMLTVSGSTISNNTATSNDKSGGILIESSILRILNSTVSNPGQGDCLANWGNLGNIVDYSNLIDTTGSTFSDNSCNQFDKAVLLSGWTAASAGSTSTVQAISDPPFAVGDKVRFCGPNQCNTTNTKSGTVTSVSLVSDTFDVTVAANVSSTTYATGIYAAAWVELPKIASISPSSGAADGGTSVTITGAGFGSPSASPTPNIAVTFDGVPATNITHVSDTIITVTTPPGSDDATVRVTGNANTLSNESNSLVGAFAYPASNPGSTPASPGSTPAPEESTPTSEGTTTESSGSSSESSSPAADASSTQGATQATTLTSANGAEFFEAHSSTLTKSGTRAMKNIVDSIPSSATRKVVRVCGASWEQSSAQANKKLARARSAVLVSTLSTLGLHGEYRVRIATPSGLTRPVTSTRARGFGDVHRPVSRVAVTYR